MIIMKQIYRNEKKLSMTVVIAAKKFFRSHFFEVKAIEWYHKAAENGHVEAMYRLGKIYETMYSVEDYLEAEQWYRNASGRKTLIIMLQTCRTHGALAGSSKPAIFIS